jgi:hypothetical protein
MMNQAMVELIEFDNNLFQKPDVKSNKQSVIKFWFT